MLLVWGMREVVARGQQYWNIENLIDKALSAEGRALPYDPWLDLQPLTQPMAIEIAQQAFSEAQHLVSLDPTALSTQQQLGRIALLLDQPDRAITAFSVAVAQQPDSPLRWLELGLAYTHLDHTTILHATDEPFWEIIPPTPQYWSLAAPHPHPDWWNPVEPITRTVFVGNHLFLRAILPPEPTMLVFWMGNQTAQPTTYQIRQGAQTLAEYRLTSEAAAQGWQAATLDLSQWAGQEIEFSLNSDLPTSGWGDIQIIPISAVRCVIVDCQQRARAAWQRGGFTADQFLHRGTVAFRQQQFEQAIRWYRYAKLLGAETTSALWFIRYRITKDQADLDRSVSTDRGWIDEEYQLRAWFERGLLFYNQNRFAEAEHDFRRAIAVPVTNPALTWRLSEAYRFLGLSLWKTDSPAAALPYVTEAVQLNPRSTWAHIHYGKILYLVDPSQVQQTDQAFTTALTLDPRPEIWQNLIEYWQWVQNKERAQQLCRTAVQHGIVIDNIGACK